MPTVIAILYDNHFTKVIGYYILIPFYNSKIVQNRKALLLAILYDNHFTMVKHCWTFYLINISNSKTLPLAILYDVHFIMDEHFWPFYLINIYNRITLLAILSEIDFPMVKQCRPFLYHKHFTVVFTKEKHSILSDKHFT